MDRSRPALNPPSSFELDLAGGSKRYVFSPFTRFVLQERYESAYELVAGSLKNAIQEEKISEFIQILFPSYPHRISSHNIKEFFEIFGRNGSRSKELLWADIRKTLREKKSLTVTYDTVLIESALNPNSWLVQKWNQLMSILAVYYFVLVPIRISFLPWNSMITTGALATDLLADILCALNIVVLGNTAYLSSRSAWITNRNKIFRRMNIGYIVSSVPLDWSVIFQSVIPVFLK